MHHTSHQGSHLFRDIHKTLSIRVKQDSVAHRSLLRRILLPEHTRTLSMVIMNAPFAPARFCATPRCGLVTPAGPFFTCPVSRDGRQTRAQLQHSNRACRMVTFLHHVNGDVQDATCQKTRYRRHTRVGARKRLSRERYQVYLHTRVETHVEKSGLESALIPASSRVTQDPVLPALIWDPRKVAFVASMRIRADALIPTTKMAGVAPRPVVI